MSEVVMTTSLERSPPRLSVGLAVFNGEDYLRDAMTSILAQTYTDFEVIISDNASTDSTAEICQDFLSDSRVRYHRNAINIGGANNENQTFLMARGEYFRLAAHDDVCAPTLFERCVDVLDASPDVVLAYTRTVSIDERGTEIGSELSQLGMSENPVVRFRELADRRHRCTQTYGVVRSNVLRTTSLQRNYTDSDRVLLCELALKGRFVEIDEPLFFKRYHGKNQFNDWRERMSWFKPSRRKGSIEFPNWIELFFLARVAVTVPRQSTVKIACLACTIEWAFKCYRALARDLLESMRTLVQGPRTQDDWKYNWE